jgi:hypothetical protein
MAKPRKIDQILESPEARSRLVKALMELEEIGFDYALFELASVSPKYVSMPTAEAPIRAGQDALRQEGAQEIIDFMFSCTDQQEAPQDLDYDYGATQVLKKRGIKNG